MTTSTGERPTEYARDGLRGRQRVSSIGFFDASAHADESTRLASNWVRGQKLETLPPNPPKVTAGEVVVHRTSELVQA